MQVDKSFSLPETTPKAAKKKGGLSGSTKALLIVVGIILVLFLWGVVAVAKTGLVEIPLVSKIVRTTSEPARTVAVPPATMGLAETVEIQVAGAANRYRRDPVEDNRNFEIRLSEATLSKSILEAGPDFQKQFPDSKILLGQIALNEGISIYVKILKDERVQTISAAFSLAVADGQPVVRFTEVRIGSERLPNWIVNLVVRPMIQKNISDYLKNLAPYGAITDVETRPGLLIIKARFNTSILGAP
ncbi:MAG: hypothetical protein V1821_00815 [bacterium]